jgi:uncharacterized membrane protein YsdA (DUF1294 family)
MKGPPFFHGIAMIGRHVMTMDITDTTTQLLLGLGGLLALVNLLALLALAIDKGRAMRGQRRIPGSFLLKLAFLGGWPGAKLGQLVFGRQTQEPPFRTRLNLIAGLQLACVAAGFGVMHAPAIDFAQVKGMAMAAIAPETAPVEVAVETAAEAPILPHRFGPGGDDASAGNSHKP